MEDYEPRSAPPSVAASYRSPIDLLALVRAHPGEDRKEIAAELAARLEREHGTVYLGERPVRDSILDIGGEEAISILLSIEDFGGIDQTLPVLAQALEPYWQRWWNEQKWQTFQDAQKWSFLAAYVLGVRQIAWIAAQYARSVVDATSVADYSPALSAIDAAESWSIHPTERRRALASEACSEARRSLYASNAQGPLMDAARSAIQAASIAAGHKTDELMTEEESAMSHLLYSAHRANLTIPVDPGSDAEERDARGYRSLCTITKRVLAPSLLDPRY